MLSRTAGSLYWMARYIERADASSRLLLMGRRLGMLPDGVSGDDWRSVLAVSGNDTGFAHDHQVTEEEAVKLLLLDADNPASIRSSIGKARANGRAARTGLSIEMWEALNDGWRRFDRLTIDRALQDLPGLMDWVRGFAARFRGAVSTSMLRNEGHDFLTIGSAIERADLTMRLLDVNYHLLLPASETLGGHRDAYRWNALLQTLSGLRAYYHVYKDNVRPWHVADFLLASRIFPRSLAYSTGQIRYHVARLAQEHGRVPDVMHAVETLDDRLLGMEEGAIFQYGLHEFVQESLTALNEISRGLGEAYHF
jgi:uncharacterized alpha-E superfamily protein